MKYFNKKFIGLIFLILIIFSAAPKTTFAAVPTFETNPILVKTQPLSNFITSVFQKAENIEQLLEFAFKLAAETLKRQLLNMIVDQIVAFIQGGGTPKFITDWPGFFRDAVDQAGGRFLKELGLGLFCSPLNLTLRAAFIPIPQFSDRSSCTLSQVGANLDSFLKNFNKGGWIAWNEMVLKPQNNVYGAYLLAWDQYEIEKSAADKAAAAEAQAGRGFLSVKKCIRSHEEVVGQYVSQAGNGPPITQTVCDEYQINTPGSVVGDLAAKAVGSDIDYIVNAQDFAAYVSAITNAILNRVFAEGVGLLHAAVSGGGGSGGGGGGGGGTSEAAKQCALFLGTSSYTECVNSVQAGKDIREFQKNNLIQIINLDLGFQNQLFGAKQSTLTVLNQSLDALNQLETCQKFGSPSTAAVKSDITVITGQIAGIQSDIIALQLKQQQIKAVTDLAQIPSLYAEVAGTVNPAATQSLALSAQNETSQKQAASLSYQQQLNLCLEQQARQQATSTTP